MAACGQRGRLGLPVPRCRLHKFGNDLIAHAGRLSGCSQSGVQSKTGQNDKTLQVVVAGHVFAYALVKPTAVLLSIQALPGHPLRRVRAPVKINSIMKF